MGGTKYSWHTGHIILSKLSSEERGRLRVEDSVEGVRVLLGEEGDSCDILNTAKEPLRI